MKNFKIAGRLVGEGAPAFIIAELSANHLQNFKLAEKTLRAIKKSGADAVKIQTYTADTITIDSDKKYFRIKQKTIWDGRTLYDLYKEAYTPWEWQPRLQKLAHALGLIFFASPFDNSAVDFLQNLKVPAYKVASFEITDHGLIEYIAKKNKPMIISTGIATLADISQALKVCKKAGNEQVAILKCTSAYPAPTNEINLKTIPDMKKRFQTVVGLSDHSLETVVPTAAVSLGAKIIEKHFILERKLGGVDAPFSLEPTKFKTMVEDVRKTELALGEVNYDLSQKQKNSRQHSRSLFVVEDIKKGEKFTIENVRSIRPGFGLHPKYLNLVLGKCAKCDIERGEPLNRRDY